MRHIVFAVIAILVVISAGCGTKSDQSQPATAKPTVTVTPVGSPGPLATIPPQIPERLRRPLTREEIMKLPPETRDMILRAQGLPVPSPTKKK
jgi:hypothetical protein